MKHILVLFTAFFPIAGFSQQADNSTFSVSAKVHLDDVKIKGENNGNGLGFSNRNRYNLDGRIQLRTDFRAEILENSPTFLDEQK